MAFLFLNLLNELGGKDKMWGFAKHLSVFPIEFHKFNNSEGRMHDSVYRLTLKSNCISDFCTKNVKMSPLENTTFLWM